jgi:probable phosphoglycerate mutase
MTRIFVIRHPQTHANVERRYLSSTDSPWTEEGLAQANALVAFVHDLDPDIVWSSPAPRALKAAHAAAPCSVPLRVVDELREIGFGLAEGLTFDQARSVGLTIQYVPSTPGAGDVGFPVPSGEVAPGGERWQEFFERVHRVRDALLELEGTVCVFTHGGTGRALVASLLGLPPGAIWAFALPTGGVAEILANGGSGTLVRLFGPPYGT